MSIRVVSSFLCVILQFGILCCLIWNNYTMVLSYSLSRDDILAYRQQCTCTLDLDLRDHISQLRLRRRGCRAGVSYCRRPLAAMTSEHSSVGHAADVRVIPTVIGNRRQNRNINNGQTRISVLQSVRLTTVTRHHHHRCHLSSSCQQCRPCTY